MRQVFFVFFVICEWAKNELWMRLAFARKELKCMADNEILEKVFFRDGIGNDIFVNSVIFN